MFSLTFATRLSAAAFAWCFAIVTCLLGSCTLTGISPSPCDSDENCPDGLVCIDDACQVDDGGDEASDCVDLVYCWDDCAIGDVDCRAACSEDFESDAVALANSARICANRNFAAGVGGNWAYYKRVAADCWNEFRECSGSADELSCIELDDLVGGLESLGDEVETIGALRAESRLAFVALYGCIDGSQQACGNAPPFNACHGATCDVAITECHNQ